MRLLGPHRHTSHTLRLLQEINTTTDLLLQNSSFLFGLLEYQIVPAMSQSQLQQQLGSPVQTLLDGEAIVPALATTGAVTTQSISAGTLPQAPAPATQGSLVLVGVNSEAMLVQPVQSVGGSFVAVTDTVLLPAIELIVDYSPDY